MKRLCLTVTACLCLILLTDQWPVCAAPAPKSAESLVAAVREAGGWVEYENKEGSAPKVVTVALGGDKLAAEHLQQLSLLPHLRTLFVDGTSDMRDFTDDFFRHNLPELPALEELSLNSTKITNSTIDVIAQRCKRLCKLNIGSTAITDEGLARMKQFPCLEELSCTNARKVAFNDSGACLKDLKLLRTLDLTGTRIDDKGLTGVVALSELRKLVLFNTPVTDKGVEHLTHLKLLQNIDLSFTKCSGKCLESLAKCPALEAVRFRGIRQMSGPALGNLKNCSRLRALDLMLTNITDDDLRLVKEAATLTELNVRETDISDKGVAHLRELRDLRILDLSCRKITDDGLGQLKPCDKLQHLALHRAAVTSAGMKHLESFPLLTELNLQSTKIDDDALQIIAGLPRLQELDISFTGISDKGLQHLRNMKQLRNLNVFKTKVTDTGEDAIRKDIPGIDVLR